MKKKIIFVLCAVVLAVAILVGGAVFLTRNGRKMQMQCYEHYQSMQVAAGSLTFTVTENGQTVGEFGLEELGVLEDTRAAVDKAYGRYERMKPEHFAMLSAWKVLSWCFERQELPQTVTVGSEQLDLTPVMEALRGMPRQDAQDAFVAYENGTFRVVQEVPGTQLDEGAVVQALEQAVTAAVVETENQNICFEMTDCACYLPAEKTVENTVFDFPQELETALETMQITVDFHGKEEVLTAQQLKDVLSVDERGMVKADEQAVSELVSVWHETYREYAVPYLFRAQVGGVKPIEFLTVDYEVDREATAQALTEVLLQLQSVRAEPVWHCRRDGEDFAIENEYVEVDIPNQKMTYVKDGEVVVFTDVVTGAAWGFPTPPGYYKIENKDTGCWLEGPDYRVFVDYWIGFIGYEYGIHDADGRTKFGGENYIRNGSHGCVNTPKEATATIFEQIEVGVPVLVYGK